MSIPVPPANAGGRKAPHAGRSGPDPDALQQALATQRADCDALLGAVVDRLRHAVVVPPGPPQAAAESLAALRATVLQCADDLARVCDLLAPPVGVGARAPGQAPSREPARPRT